MPRVKPIDEYPEAYFHAFTKAFEAGEFRVPCANHDAAKAVRSHLYTFRRVLRKTPEYDKLTIKADTIKLRVDGSDLVLYRKEQFAEHLIKEALGDEYRAP